VTRRLVVALGLASAGWSAPAEASGLLLISIDGLNPDYILNADARRLKIPTLRRLLRDGSHARSVRGVLPTVTYPTHTTMLTGVWPVKHGIALNTTYDPKSVNLGGWYWYAEDIRVPTLWEAAAQAGYTVGSLSWPVSVSAGGVRYLIPEYWRSMKGADDLKLMRALSTPGLISELEAKHGKYIIDLDVAVPGDWMRTRYAASIIRDKGARVFTLHLASLDHIEHDTGPGTKQAYAALEEIDKMVGTLEDAMRAVAPRAAICVVSDHGMARVEHELNLGVALAKSGAKLWSAGGSAAVMLDRPQSAGEVERALRTAAADRSNGIHRVLDRAAIAALGGASGAAFWVDLKPGFVMGSAVAGPMVKQVPVRGTHGYSPEHPEMRATFLIAGPGIRRGADLGDIDLRSIAPTLAKHLGVNLPTADLQALPVFGK
jgi:predicted AlkP superfamily pyrophosphatase or phosphodiesterase